MVALISTLAAALVISTLTAVLVVGALVARIRSTFEPIANNGDIAELQKVISEWADTLIPNRTAHDALTKLAMEELPEFFLNTDDPGEYADLVILILDIAELKGIDVKKAVLGKMEINRSRVWEINPDTGIMRHKQ